MKETGKSIRNKSYLDTRDGNSRDDSRNGEWQSEKDLSILLSNIADAILKSRGGKIVWCNDRVNEVLGYTKDELIGTNARFLFPDDAEHSEMYRRVHCLTAEQSYVRGTTKVRKKDGSEVFIEFSISRIPGKEPAEFITAASDVTKRKLAEFALRESEDRYRLLAQNVTDVIWTMDMNLHYTYVSPSIQQQRGYGPEEFTALDRASAYTSNTLNNAVDMLMEHTALTNSEQSKPQKSWSVEMEANCKDGSTIWVESKMAFLYDQDGAAAGILGVSRDITKRKLMEEALRKANDELEERVRERTLALVEANQELKAEISERMRVEEELRHSEERFRALIENSTDIITVLNADGTLRYESPSSTHLLGYEPGSKIGKTSFELVHPDDISGVTDVFSSLLGDPGGTAKLDVRVLHHDGSWRNLEVTATNLLENPAVAGIVVNQRDITDRMKAEEALREAETRYKAIFDNRLQMVYVLNEQGSFLDANDCALERLGYTRKDLGNVTMADILHPDDLPRAVEALHEIWSEGYQQRPYEFRLINKLGEIIHVLAYTIPLHRNEEHYLELGIAHDITQIKESEAALRESEEKLTRYLESSPDAIYISDIKGVFLYGNKQAEKIIGYSREELIGRSFLDLDLLPQEYLLKAAQLLELNKAAHPTGPDEFELVRKDGGRVFLEISTYPIGEGEKIEVIGIARDITDRKRTEEALKSSEERYRLVVENANEAIVVAQDGIFKFANQNATEITGYTREELLSKPFIELIHPDDREMVADRHLRRLGGEDIPNIYSFRIVDKNSTVKWVEINAVAVTWEGKPATLNFLTDITERMNAEERLRRSEEYFRSLIENARDAMVIVSADATVVYESPSLERMLGYELKEHFGENALQFVHQDDIPRITEIMARLLQNPDGVVQDEVRVWHKNGSLRTLEVVGHNLLHNPSVAGIVANLRDITDRRRAEEDREKMEQQLQLAGRLAAVGELAAGVAHELNNPLSAIQAYAEFLSTKDDLEESAKKDAAVIHREAQRAARVTANLLSFARRSVPEKSPISINEVIEKSLELHAYRMRVNNIEVTTELDPDLPRTMADFHQLQQVFINIINNAEQSMTEANGKGRLTVKTQTLSRMIRTSFTDNGPGIAEENLQKIFDPFYTTKAVGKGTGLGLSISFGIVQDHGGRLYARSKPGKGTTFIVEIPIVPES